MGIRFLCPNGHKLNVKAYLVGERGICPRCDAKFLVPKESGGQVEAIGEPVAADANEDLQQSDLQQGDLQQGSPEPPPAPSLPPAPPAVETPATGEDWHVRMASGEQFGPASVDVMRGWVAEGRVPVDGWVWRTGWPEWKPGGQAITLLNGPAAPTSSAASTMPAIPSAPTPAPAPTSAPTEIPETPSPEDLPTAANPSAKYHNSKRNRQDRARKVTFFLGGLVLLLIVVLAVVLMK